MTEALGDKVLDELAATPLGRAGEVQEAADVVVFLADIQKHNLIIH